MDQSGGAAAAVPGDMTQPEEQGGHPMELDADRGPLSQEEQEAWIRSEARQAAELGEEIAEKLIAAQKEAAATEAARSKGSSGKGRSPSTDRMQRRALRSSSREGREGGTENPPALEAVSEAGEEKKVPSDGEGEEEEPAGEEEEVVPGSND
eukprot:12254283-Heterocapsa_arctica.AAC.1